MKNKLHPAWLLCGLAIAASAPATAAETPKPANSNRADKQPLTGQERKALAAAVREQHRNFKQPATEAQAKATLVRQPGGLLQMQVPTSLWNHLSVTTDAQGNLHQHEYESSDVSAPAHSPEGLENE